MYIDVLPISFGAPIDARRLFLLLVELRACAAAIEALRGVVRLGTTGEGMRLVMGNFGGDSGEDSEEEEADAITLTGTF
jgi:hypothetical protein